MNSNKQSFNYKTRFETKISIIQLCVRFKRLRCIKDFEGRDGIFYIKIEMQISNKKKEKKMILNRKIIYIVIFAHASHHRKLIGKSGNIF